MHDACLVGCSSKHGFRKAANIQRALNAELGFYGRIFGFTTDVGEEVDTAPQARI